MTPYINEFGDPNPQRMKGPTTGLSENAERAISQAINETAAWRQRLAERASDIRALRLLEEAGIGLKDALVFQKQISTRILRKDVETRVITGALQEQVKRLRDLDSKLLSFNRNLAGEFKDDIVRTRISTAMLVNQRLLQLL